MNNGQLVCRIFYKGTYSRIAADFAKAITFISSDNFYSRSFQHIL